MSDPATIIELPAPNRMTPEQLFAVAGRTAWDEAIVLGFDDEGEFICLNAMVTNERALLMAKLLERWAMSAFEGGGEES